MTISIDAAPLVTAISLPADLQWTDEFEWHPVAQTTERSLTGALLVQEAALTYGRPITLQGGDTGGWVARSTVIALKALADDADLIMTLDYHGTEYSVIWDRSGNPISASELFRLANPGPEQQYNNLTLRLLTVEPPAP